MSDYKKLSFYFNLKSMLEYVVLGSSAGSIVLFLHNHSFRRLYKTRVNFLAGKITSEECVKELKKFLRYSPFCRKDAKELLSFAEDLYTHEINSIPELVEKYKASRK